MVILRDIIIGVTMKKLLVLFVLLFAGNCFGQTPVWDWAKDGQETGGTNAVCEVYNMKVDHYGNSFLLADFYDTLTLGSYVFHAFPSGTSNFVIAKYSITGNLLWAKVAPGTSNNSATCITTDIYGNVYLAGLFGGTIHFGSDSLTCPFGTLKIFFAKYDPLGNVVWAKSIQSSGNNNPDAISNMAADNQGNIYLCGGFMTTTITFGTTTLINTGTASFSSDNTFLAKYDGAGNFLWAMNPTGSIGDYGVAVTVDDLNNVYLTGYFSYQLSFGAYSFTASTNFSNCYLVKFNPLGNILWAKQTNNYNTTNISPSSIVTTHFGKVIIGGMYGTGGAIPPLTFDTVSVSCNGVNGKFAFIVQYDSLGNADWAKCGSKATTGAYSVAADNNGNCYLSGGFQYYPITMDTMTLPLADTTHLAQDNMFVFKFNSNGNVIWGKSFPAGGDDNNAVAVNDCDVYIGGDYMYSPFILGNDTLRLNRGLENPFITMFHFPPCEVGLGIEENTNPESLTLYPNPATTTFTIESTNKIRSIKVINVIGEVVSTSSPTGNSKTTIDLSGVAKGIYFVQITDENKTVVNKKIVVQ